MEGFEKDKWTLKNVRPDYKVAIHRIQFITIVFKKHGIAHTSGNLEGASLNNWSINVMTRDWRNKTGMLNTGIVKSYKKLSKDRVPELFDELMERDSTKYLIFSYIFESEKFQRSLT